MKKTDFAVLGLLLVLIHVAATDSRTGTAPSTSASKKVFSAATPQSVVSETIVKFFRPKTGKELMEEKKKPVPPAVKAPPPAPAGFKISPLSATAQKKVPPVKPGYVPPPPPKAATPQADQIRQEVQKILNLNKQIKNLQGDRVLQLQRIQEQARIHQKILDQLEAGKRAQTTQSAPDKNAFLDQEKLRLIQEETQRNQALLTGTGNATQTQAQKSGVKVVAIPQGKTAQTN